MLKYKGVGPTVQMVTCVNWTFIQGNHNKESNLCQNVQGKWYAIFCDNFFTSYKLLQDLYDNKILCFGTCDQATEFPACLYDKVAIKRMNRGDVWRIKGPVQALTWMDKKAVHAAGTFTQAPSQQLPEVSRKQMGPFRK